MPFEYTGKKIAVILPGIVVKVSGSNHEGPPEGQKKSPRLDWRGLQKAPGYGTWCAIDVRMMSHPGTHAIVRPYQLDFSVPGKAATASASGCDGREL